MSLTHFAGSGPRMERVDVLLATYNGERYIEELVASLQIQTFAEWRLLVSDDCSTDRTLALLERLAGIDERIRIVSSDVRHGGAKENFMFLLSRSDAPYVMFCDQDDVWLPDKIEATLGRMKHMERRWSARIPLLAFADMAVVDERLEIISPSFERYSGLNPSRLRLQNLLEENVAAGCSMMLNRELADLCSIEGDISKMRMHDWWAMLVASTFGKIDYVDEPLSLYRQHGDNQIGARAYSFFMAPASSKSRSEALSSHIDQAELFLRVYGDRLPNEHDRRSLHAFAALGDATTFAGGGRGVSEVWLLEEGHSQRSWPDRDTCVLASDEQATFNVPTGIAAGIVTYNPDESRLAENIEAISHQVNEIFVFDNASNADGASAVREALQTVVVSGANVYMTVYWSASNLGVAAALNALARVARAKGYEFIVMLDQDSVAGEGFAEALESAMYDDTAIVGAVTVDVNTGVREKLSGPVVEVGGTITSGSLVRLKAWESTGGYDERFFVDWVDFDFCNSLLLDGWAIRKASNAFIMHELGHKEIAFKLPRRSQEEAHWELRSYYRTNHAMFRRRDMARSWTISIAKRRGTAIAAREAKIVLHEVMKSLICEKHKVEIIRQYLAGSAEGMRLLFNCRDSL